jgi:hypothetical protein
MRAALLALLVAAAACSPGGQYVSGGRMSRDGAGDRGDTNGRSFDFVSSKPDGSEWTLRLRGSSLWVAYSEEDRFDELGAVRLDDAQLARVWELIENVGVLDRDPGEPDDDAGTVLLRQREPDADGRHEMFSVYVSRDTEDEDVLDLADYLATLVKAHRGERPGF